MHSGQLLARPSPWTSLESRRLDINDLREGQMKNRFAVLTALLAVGVAATAQAQTATQSVSYEVQAINKIAVSGSPSLTISTAVAGNAPTSVTANATYAITTNESNRKITAQLDENMPSGLALTIELAAPTGATSAGAQSLSTDAADLVTGVSLLNESGLSMSYTLSATAAAGVVASSSRTVTFTVAAGA